MIRAVRANQKGFHTAFLQPGVNLILADRSTSAGDKDTTNALGKSTLIEIIDFCLASNTSPGKGLRIEALQGWAFTLELSLSGRDVAFDAPDGWTHVSWRGFPLGFGKMSQGVLKNHLPKGLRLR